jgi:hypothetical protein
VRANGEEDLFSDLTAPVREGKKKGTSDRKIGEPILLKL